MLEFTTILGDRILIDARQVVCVEEQQKADPTYGLLTRVCLASGHSAAIRDPSRTVAAALGITPGIPDHDPHPPGAVMRVLQLADQLAAAVLAHVHGESNGNPMLIGLARALEEEVVAYTRPEPDRPMPAEAATDA